MKKLVLLFFFVLLHASFTQREITWVAIGDSITYLNEHPDETGNRITKGYMTGVVEKLPAFHYINKGYNGWTAVKIATDIEKLNIPSADVYSIFLGTNDWWGSKPLGTLADYENNTGVATVQGSFRVIINKLRSLNAQAKIVLITPMQRVDFIYINNYKNNAFGSYKEKNGQHLEQFADAIVAIAKKEGIPVVDLYHKKGMDHANLVRFKYLKDPATGQYKKFSYPDFVDVPFNPTTDEYPYPVEASHLTYDGLHPSDEGYEMITKELVKIFKKW
ncbi:SGNH/GDSL hydrolase family protein [Aquirufa nivalisilvae]|uniref:SGNH/GDSL hydrolase family protein n=1 Tax=Aquirufa nivalisilvae TaxID=2516557 RepID=UPI0022A96E08|nr:SGNH/GDSL hydrolase family protein [Aquirufa nivalisilvae]MCZ2483190.1 SGNH/GDSL hydrolase family protein [Aquirufa nivalisilvae]